MAPKPNEAARQLLPPAKRRSLDDNSKLLPVTVLSGFLGAGKTTLLKHILRSVGNEGGPGGKDMKVAVIVNDMGEVNLDASEIKNSKLIHEEASMVELHNGCICCTLRGDLLKTVKALSEEASFDYLVIESTGISEPLPVAMTFAMDVEDGMLVPKGQAPTEKDKPVPGEKRSLGHFSRLDTMVTVVDALNVYEVLNSLEKLSEKNVTGMLGNTGLESTAGGPTDDRSIAQLMLEQVEFADVILLSKVGMLLEKRPREALDEVVRLLKKLNPLAQVHAPEQPHFSGLPLRAVVGTRLFDMQKAQASAGWLHELTKEEQGGHTPETEEYGINSLVFRSREKPFHPVRLQKLLASLGHYESSMKAGDEAGEKPFAGVVRAKGQLWVATSHSYPVELQLAGRHIQLQPSRRFYLAAIPEEEWPEGAHMECLQLMSEGKWTMDYGDRETVAVFIGVRLEKEKLIEEFEKALLTQKEMEGGPESWRSLPDVFFDGAYFELTSQSAFPARYESV